MFPEKSVEVFLLRLFCGLQSSIAGWWSERAIRRGEDLEPKPTGSLFGVRDFNPSISVRSASHGDPFSDRSWRWLGSDLLTLLRLLPDIPVE